MKKQLFRIKNGQSMLGGVALGLSEYFDLDVTLVRVLLVMGILLPVPVLLPYVVLWAIMPVKHERSLNLAV